MMNARQLDSPVMMDDTPKNQISNRLFLFFSAILKVFSVFSFYSDRLYSPCVFGDLWSNNGDNFYRRIYENNEI